MADQHDTVDDGQLLKILIKKRGSVKFRLTHLVKQLDAVEKDISSIEELQFVEWKQKADRMPLLWDEFAGIQCQIESLSDEPDQFQERVDFENKYDRCLARLKQLLKKSSEVESIKSVKSCGSNQTSASVKESIKSDAGSNKSENAYKALKERYNNEKVLVHQHIQGIFNIEKIMRESASELRKIIDTLSKHLRSIVQLGQPIDNWDALIIFIVTSKLPKVTNQDWEKQNKKFRGPTIEKFREFLIDRADFLQTIESKNQEKAAEKFESKHNRIGQTRGCGIFNKLSVNERIDKAKQLRLCLNCLKPGHFSTVCRANTCKRCNYKHHVLLHKETSRSNLATELESAHSANDAGEAPRNSNDTFEQPSNSNGGERAETASVAISVFSSNNFVLLSTASVIVRGKHGKSAIVRAVLDSGSQSSYLTSDKLWLEKIDWDSALSPELGKQWLKLKNSLMELNKIQINRKVICDDAMKVELHGFSDASAEAYGAAIYNQFYGKIGAALRYGGLEVSNIDSKKPVLNETHNDRIHTRKYRGQPRITGNIVNHIPNVHVDPVNNIDFLEPPPLFSFSEVTFNEIRDVIDNLKIKNIQPESRFSVGIVSLDRHSHRVHGQYRTDIARTESLLDSYMDMRIMRVNAAKSFKLPNSAVFGTCNSTKKDVVILECVGITFYKHNTFFSFPHDMDLSPPSQFRPENPKHWIQSSKTSYHHYHSGLALDSEGIVKAAYRLSHPETESYKNLAPTKGSNSAKGHTLLLWFLPQRKQPGERPDDVNCCSCGSAMFELLPPLLRVPPWLRCAAEKISQSPLEPYRSRYHAEIVFYLKDNFKNRFKDFNEVVVVAQFVVSPFMEIDIQRFATFVTQNFSEDIIVTEMEDDYRKILRLFREEEVPHHTFPLPSERNIHAVVRGVPVNFSDTEIKGELDQRGYSPLHIIRLKRSGGAPMPLVVVILPKTGKSQQVFNDHELLGLAI
ncbi:unnamed protein product [Acanthoscelides obtectus]|uniref:Peptidase aspartic putative domain-containing protein n=1 Tax=Acanthoscelides obtectus TaxID=200917 RepID=A0A9P0LA02_ACAOB|nr:unnamed protein product [Acanthoscelides obtectus]CAK1633047.1 hypothetical protein AOBTE_LOCUS7903 [Acanthoscelides obtectus]